MKNLFATDTKYLNGHLALLVGRIAFAVLMLTHGLPKLAALFSGDPVQFPAVFGMSAELSLTLAVFAEVICSLLLLVGLGTRAATIPLIVTMLVAVFSIHAADAFAQKELAVLYLVAFVIFFVAGSGKYSIDHLLYTRDRVKKYEGYDDEDPYLAYLKQ